MDFEPPSGKDHAPCLDLVHQRQIMGSDHYRCAGAVQLHEQAQQAPGQGWIDIACWLIGKQHFRLVNQCPCDGGALLFATGENRRQDMDSVTKADPLQQFYDITAVTGLFLARPRNGRATFS